MALGKVARDAAEKHDPCNPYNLCHGVPPSALRSSSPVCLPAPGVRLSSRLFKRQGASPSFWRQMSQLRESFEAVSPGSKCFYCSNLQILKNLLLHNTNERDARAPRPPIYTGSFSPLPPQLPLQPLPLLLRPRLRRHQPITPVIHHQLPVVLARVLDQSVGQV